MQKKERLQRETWTLDHQYLIRAYAKFDGPQVNSKKRYARAVVQVFKGDPAITFECEIFFAVSVLHGEDLLDELQNAERIARDFIEATGKV